MVLDNVICFIYTKLTLRTLSSPRLRRGLMARLGMLDIRGPERKQIKEPINSIIIPAGTET